MRSLTGPQANSPKHRLSRHSASMPWRHNANFPAGIVTNENPSSIFAAFLEWKLWRRASWKCNIKKGNETEIARRLFASRVINNKLNSDDTFDIFVSFSRPWRCVYFQSNLLIDRSIIICLRVRLWSICYSCCRANEMTRLVFLLSSPLVQDSGEQGGEIAY